MIDKTPYYSMWHKLARGTPSTLREYQNALKVFDQYLVSQGVTLDDFSIDQFWEDEETGRTYPMDQAFIEEYVEWLSDTYESTPSRPRLLYAGLRNFFMTLHYNGLISVDPTEHAIRPAAYFSPPGVSLSRMEYEALVRAATKKDDGSKYYPSLIRILVECGLRNRELRYLTLDQLSLSQRSIRVDKGHKTRSRVVKFTANTCDILTHYAACAHLSGSAILFPHSSGRMLRPDELIQIVTKLAIDAGLNKHVTPHALRRTTATMMYNKGIDPEVIREFMGHESVNTTKRHYISLTKGEDRSAIDGIAMTAQLPSLVREFWNSD